jgi:hypothetical protein
MTISTAKLTCTNCGHHMYSHNYADPKKLTKKERKSGLIPWYCDIQDCDCIEYIPGK